MQRSREDRGLVLLAILSLGIGVAVYLLDRGGSAYFVPAEIASALPVRTAFGFLSGSLPAFVHILAFALLTAVLLGPACFAPGRICAAWWSLDTAFELGQAGAISGNFLDRIPAALQDVWPIGHIAGYFRYGTFDALDLLAITLGAAAAYFVISATGLKGDRT